MKTKYRVNNLTIQIRLDNPKLKANLCELVPWKFQAKKPCMGELDAKLDKKLLALPDKAIRTNFDKATPIYRYQDTTYYFTPNSALAVDQKRCRIQLRYKQLDGTIHWLLEQATRALIKLVAIKKGHVYLPGHPVVLEDKLILVTGPQNCGELDCLHHLAKIGAVSAGANLLLNSKTNQAMLFPLGTSGMKEDAKRIRQILPSFTQLSESSNERKLSKLIFVFRWNASNTTIQKLPSNLSSLELGRINKRYYEYLSPSARAQLEKKYLKYLKNKCYQINLGSSERSAKLKLKNLFLS